MHILPRYLLADCVDGGLFPHSEFHSDILSAVLKRKQAVDFGFRGFTLVRGVAPVVFILGCALVVVVFVDHQPGTRGDSSLPALRGLFRLQACRAITDSRLDRVPGCFFRAVHHIAGGFLELPDFRWWADVPSRFGGDTFR